MSKVPKKLSDMPSVTQYLQRAAERAGLDVAAAGEHLEVACADSNPIALAIKDGHRLFHKTCGAPADLVVVPAIERPGSYAVGATCPKCLRHLMDGELFID